MLSFDSTQQTIVDAEQKSVMWLLEVDRDNNGTIDDYWSIESLTYNSQAYIFKIVDFTGMDLDRYDAEVQAPNKTSFTILNPGNVLSAATYKDAAVTVKLIVSANGSTAQIAAWKVNIIECQPVEQTLQCECEDILQKHQEGDYPNKQAVSGKYPADFMPDDNLVEPTPFGSAYVPLRPITVGENNYYLLGPNSLTYTIAAVHCPYNNTEWTSGFNQSNQGSDRVFQPIIADKDNDGIDESCGLFWDVENRILDLPTKLSRSDTQFTTNPASVIEFILQDKGLAAGEISAAAITAAAAKFTTWGLAFNGAYYYTESFQKILAQLLAMSHSCIRRTDQVELYPLSKTSQKTITSADILKPAQTGPSSFSYSPLRQENSDSGYVAWQVAGKPQHRLGKNLVPAKSSIDNISSETIEIRFVQNSQHVQKIGSLNFQREFCKLADVSFVGLSSLVGLQPNDMITLNDPDNGGPYDVRIDNMHINPDLSISFRGTKFSVTLDDWENLTFSTITPVNGDSTGDFKVVTVGPGSNSVSSGKSPNQLPGRMQIGGGSNFIILEPEGPVIELYEGGTKRFALGELGTNNIGFSGWDDLGNVILKADSDDAKLAGWDLTEYTLKAANGMVGLNSEVTGGTDLVFWAGHLTPSMAPFRIDELGNLVARAGTIGGLTIGTTTLSLTGITIDSANNRIRVSNGDNRVDLTGDGLTGYNADYGTTLRLYTDGTTKSFFSKGEIRECEYQIYTSGVIKTADDPAATDGSGGGLIINNTDLKGYNSAGLKLLQLVYDGTDEGDAYMGDFDGGNVGIKLDFSAGDLDVRGNLHIQNTSEVQAVVSGVSFRNGFESAEFSDWNENSGDGNTLAQNADAFSGSYAALVTSNNAAPSSSGPTDGIYITVPEQIALQFGDKRIRVTVYAKQPASNASAEFAVAYSTNDNGNSGWQDFTPTTSWAPYTFTYDVPVPISGGTDYIGIHGDTSGSGDGILIDNVVVEIVAAETELDAGIIVTAGLKATTTIGGGGLAAKDGSDKIRAFFGISGSDIGSILYGTDGSTILAKYVGTGLTLEAGGDIHMNATSTDESQIIFQCEDRDVILSSNYENNSVVCHPSSLTTDFDLNFFVIGHTGAAEMPFGYIFGYADYMVAFYVKKYGTIGCLDVGYHSTMIQSWEDDFPVDRYAHQKTEIWTSTAEAYQKAGFDDKVACLKTYASATLSYIGVTGDQLFPMDNNTTDNGRSDYAWKDLYYYNPYDQCLFLDDLDDLKILNEMKANGKLDQATELPELSINSLPRWMTNYDKLKKEIKKENGDLITDEDFDELIQDKAELGYRFFRHAGHFNDLVAGSVRQLNKKVEGLVGQIEVLAGQIEEFS